MKLYHRGLEFHTSYELHRLGSRLRKRLPKLQTDRFEARIVSGRLYVKAIHRLPIERGLTLKLPEEDWHIHICMHRIACRRRTTHYLYRLLESKLVVELRNSGEVPPPTPPTPAHYGCDFCFTEFKVDVERSGNDDQKYGEFIITAWQDYGRLESPFDPVWYLHFQNPFRLGDVRFEHGSIQRAFEGNPGSLDESRRVDNVPKIDQDFAGYMVRAW